MTAVDEGNSWLSEDAARVDVYLNAADVIVVERNRTIRILVDLVGYQFENPKNLNMLDLGCGDGILTKHVWQRYPDNSFHLMDGSAHMIEKARANMPGDAVSFSHQSFEDYIDSPSAGNRYDVAYSANAIHHLDESGKGSLYSKLYNEMRQGGLFINIDVVKPASEKSEQLQFRMWTDWMNETLFRNGLRGDVGKYDRVPELYKNNGENKPSGLAEQLGLLSAAGFRDVDCFFKYGVFAVFGGTKR